MTPLLEHRRVVVPDRAREGDAGNAQTDEAQGFKLGKDDEGEREK